MGSGKGQSKRVSNTRVEPNIYVPRNLIRPEVNLDQIDGNAFAIMGVVAKAMRKAGNDEKIVNDYLEQCQSATYEHLLRVSMAFTESPFTLTPGEENVIDGTRDQAEADYINKTYRF